MRDVLEQDVKFTLEYMKDGKAGIEPFMDRERAHSAYDRYSTDTRVTYVCLLDQERRILRSKASPREVKAA